MTSQGDRHMRSLAFTGFVTLLVMWAMGCDSPEQTVYIVAEDFRFTPAEVHVSAERPIRLRIANEGREPHELKSPLLMHQTGATGAPASSLPPTTGPRPSFESFPVSTSFTVRSEGMPV